MKTLKMMIEDDFATSMGIEVVTICSGYAKLRMKVTEKHLNAGGVCHGGAIFTLADLAFAAAVDSHLKLTLSLNAMITYLKVAKPGYVYAEAVEVSNHEKIPYVEVSVRDEAGELIARLISSGYRKREDMDVSGLM